MPIFDFYNPKIKAEVQVDNATNTTPDDVKVEVKQTESNDEDDGYDFGLMKW